MPKSTKPNDLRVVDPTDCSIGVLILMRGEDQMHNLKCAMYLAGLFDQAEHGEEAMVVAIPPDLAIPTIMGVGATEPSEPKSEPEGDPMPLGMADFLRRCTPRGHA